VALCTAGAERDCQPHRFTIHDETLIVRIREVEQTSAGGNLELPYRNFVAVADSTNSQARDLELSSVRPGPREAPIREFVSL
jgi:hypothetical protein